MEENSTLFTLTIDPVTKVQLTETAKWARFLAIVGFVFLGLLVLGGLFLSASLARLGMMDDSSGFGGVAGFAGMGVAIMYIIFALIGFFPMLFIFRFANQMRSALRSDDQNLLNSSFQNRKAYFRFFGILTIISLVLMALSFLIGLGGLALS